MQADPIKAAFSSIVVPLLHVVNLSFSQGIFPRELKIAQVVPLFKKGSTRCIGNYRPISLLPLFSKILEKLAHKRLFHYISSNDLLSHCQFGFQPGKNTTMALLSVVDKISKSFENKDQLMGSYTRRIDRPRGWYLDPFITYMDQFNYRQGNPNLEPEYTDSYEISYIKRISASMISLEGYYRVTNNKITRIRTLQEDGSFLHTYDNINNDYSIGGELMLRTDPTDWLNLTVSGNLYHYRIDGAIADQEIDTESLNWNARLNAILKLPKDFRVQLSGMFNGPTVRAQGEREGFFMTNAAVKKDFFDKHLSLTASVRDIFATAKYEFTSTGESFYTYDYFDREAPIFSLAVSWQINNYKRQMEKNGNGEGGMDMDMDF